mmetsp:Transcript_19619/g.34996  ORF Transcript_19619/g.34996 Transcript_19619/m.34996 type:complete len:231 (+) Transcript_19619:2-694(+)
MPVMLWGMVILGKRYAVSDWFVAACVSCGVAQFLFIGNISPPHDAHSSSGWGLLLLLGFLTCDGLTSTFQERLFKEHQTSTYNQLLYINLCSAMTSYVALLGTGSFWVAVGFCVQHPMILRDIAMLSAAATTAQLFIYSEVKEFGALVFAATMNLRQVVSILASHLYYGHQIHILQAVSLFEVFAALFYKSYAGFVVSKPSEAAPLWVEKDSGAIKKRAYLPEETSNTQV